MPLSVGQHTHNNALFIPRVRRSTTLGSDRDEVGAYLIDRSPVLFEHILNYLRTNKLIYETHSQVQAILLEAEFYNLQAINKQILLLFIIYF